MNRRDLFKLAAAACIPIPATACSPIAVKSYADGSPIDLGWPSGENAEYDYWSPMILKYQDGTGYIPTGEWQ